MTRIDPVRHHRRSVRLKGYDYAQPGMYFITIVTQNRACLFGHVENGDMHLNDAGRIAEQCWLAIPEHFPHVTLDAYVIMPNHVHGIIVIMERVGSTIGAKNFSPLQQPSSVPRSPSKTIGSIVRGFKIGVTKWIRANTDVHAVWQRNYYDHIIRNESSLDRIRQYIADNPARWDTDRENPEA